MTLHGSILEIPPAFGKMKWSQQSGVTIKRLGPNQTELQQYRLNSTKTQSVTMTDSQLLQLRDYLNDLFDVEK